MAHNCASGRRRNRILSRLDRADGGRRLVADQPILILRLQGSGAATGNGRDEGAGIQRGRIGGGAERQGRLRWTVVLDRTDADHRRQRKSADTGSM